MQVKFAIPSKITKVARVEKTASTDPKHFDAGFQAGYQAGRWQAELEQQKWIETQKAEWVKSLEALTSLHQETKNLIAEDFPLFAQTIVEKLLKKNPYTPDQIAEEIQCFLRDLSEAHSIRIECSAEDLLTVQGICEKTGMNLGQGSVQWKSHADLASGEYRIQSDLGSIDGRLQPKLAKLKIALERP
jgi:flagellar biosynthesis/type III secretory pathway protein FliH